MRKKIFLRQGAKGNFNAQVKETFLRQTDKPKLLNTRYQDRNWKLAVP